MCCVWEMLSTVQFDTAREDILIRYAFLETCFRLNRKDLKSDNIGNAATTSITLDGTTYTKISQRGYLQVYHKKLVDTIKNRMNEPLTYKHSKNHYTNAL